MQERENFVPQEIKDPEYWDGHSFNDDCQLPRYTLGYAKQRMQEVLAESRATNILSTYLWQITRAHTQRFTAVEEFDANQMPDGTILRFTRESLYKNPAQRYEGAENFWAVVVDLHGGQNRQAVIACYPPQRNWRDFKFFTHMVHGPKLKVGEVEHLKTKKIGEAESISRPLGIELCYLGGGKRRRVNLFDLLPKMRRPLPFPVDIIK